MSDELDRDSETSVEPGSYTLEQYTSWISDKIKEFRAYWEVEAAKSSEEWPAEQWLGDWSEQFMAWLDNQPPPATGAS